MSAGAFVKSKYEADNGKIHPCKVQPETLTANLGSVNAAPAGDVDVNFKARSTGGNRAYGIKMRAVTVKFTGSLPTGYEPNQLLRIPVLTKAVFDAIVADSTTGNYLGHPILVVGKIRESGRG